MEKEKAGNIWIRTFFEDEKKIGERKGGKYLEKENTIKRRKRNTEKEKKEYIMEKEKLARVDGRTGTKGSKGGRGPKKVRKVYHLPIAPKVAAAKGPDPGINNTWRKTS